MELKLSVQGGLIYATMATYLLAFALYWLRGRAAGRAVYALGFAVAAVSYGYRWAHTGHMPLANLFECFLLMGALVPVISLLSLAVLRVDWMGWDILLGAAMLFPAGFVAKFSESIRPLVPSLQTPLFVPHVLVYMLAYVVMAKAAVAAIAQLAGARPDPARGLVDAERATYRLICLGFVPLTGGLLLGSWWAKICFGDFWMWDPKEIWSLVSWLVYAVYFHVRHMWGRKHARLNTTIALVGMAAIFITLLWVNLSSIFGGYHSYAT